jgi:hypothetical protein
VSLRGHAAEATATLPDGREAFVRVGVPDDSYVPKRELSTVTVEIAIGGEIVAVVDTILEPEQDREGLALAREIAVGLGSGALAPTAGAIEPLADSYPAR